MFVKQLYVLLKQQRYTQIQEHSRRERGMHTTMYQLYSMLHHKYNTTERDETVY